MPAHLRRPRPRPSAFVSALIASWLVIVAAAPASAASTWSRDLWFPAAYEHQVDGRTCTAASTAMMMNLIARRDLKLAQMSILRYEQPRDALNDAVQRGSDPLGWSRAATYYSRYTSRTTTYRWESFSTQVAAQKRAVQQLARTGKPVGLLVAHGTHAMVLTGATASANPVSTSSFVVGSVAVSDPNGTSHRWYHATSSPLNKYLETDATAWYDGAWYGKYVIIVPQG
jgi:hypothetical protein